MYFFYDDVEQDGTPERVIFDTRQQCIDFIIDNQLDIDIDSIQELTVDENNYK